jgi:septum formation protein
VVLDGELLGKPRDAEDAAAMLRRLAGRDHEVSTGVAVFDVEVDRLDVAVDTTRVRFAPLSEAEIAWYVSTGEPMDKAGAYAIQELASLFVTAIEGNHSNVVGLPVPVVYRLLAARGVRPASVG